MKRKKNIISQVVALLVIRIAIRKKEQNPYPNSIAQASLAKRKAPLLKPFIYFYTGGCYKSPSLVYLVAHSPRLHILTLCTVMPLLSPSPQVGIQAWRALQNWDMALSEPSIQGLLLYPSAK